MKNIIFETFTKEERLEMAFPGQDKKTVFTPGYISVSHVDGRLIQERNDPEKSFEGQERDTPWDDIHVAYFSGEAFFTYLTTPFIYTYPGFVAEELEPIQENGETLRRLKVTFPDNFKSHTKVQISLFGLDGLLRRHDYTVDILGGATGVNYASDYRDVNGLIIPTKRRIYAFEGDHFKGDHIVIPEPLLVSIDMGEIIINE